MRSNVLLATRTALREDMLVGQSEQGEGHLEHGKGRGKGRGKCVREEQKDKSKPQEWSSGNGMGLVLFGEGPFARVSRLHSRGTTKIVLGIVVHTPCVFFVRRD